MGLVVCGADVIGARVEKPFIIGRGVTGRPVGAVVSVGIAKGVIADSVGE